MKLNRKLIGWSALLLIMSSSSWAGVLAGESFADYIARTQADLKEHKVWLDNSQWQRELAAVSPFELMPNELASCSPTVYLTPLFLCVIQPKPYRQPVIK